VIKAILVDDELNVRNLLRILVNAHCPDIDIVAECSDLSEAVRSIRKQKPDLVFLDIEMPGHSGLELLDFFEEHEINFHILFTTAYSEYAIQAFDLSAVGYLLKPIKPDKLKEAVVRFRKLEQKLSFSIDQLKHNLSGTPNKRITLANKYKTYYVNLTDIVYIKGDGAYSEFYLNDANKIVVSKNLKHFEDILTHHSLFIRISKQCIINKAYVLDFKKGVNKVLLSGNVSLQVSPDKTSLLFD
jgi:two-component system LytT family response regulator